MKLGRDLHRLGFELYATAGTAVALEKAGLPVTSVAKASEPGLTTVRLIKEKMVGLVLNTPLGQRAYADQAAMYQAAIQHNVPLITTLSAAQAAVNGIKALREKELQVRSLQQHHQA
jgi:carbamoyl-phosphate synthase large subunit